MYVLAPNQTVEKFPYSIGDLRKDNPQVSFPANPSLATLAAYNVFPVVSTGAQYDPETEVATQDGCTYTGTRWETAWTVRDKTPEEIEADYQATIPQSVTMRQARLALLAANLLDTVDAAITQAGGAAKIEWEYAATVERGSTLVAGMTAALGMTEVQIDGLFVAAGAL
jgi:hypothetical protein